MTSKRGVSLFLFNGKERDKFKGLEVDSKARGEAQARMGLGTQNHSRPRYHVRKFEGEMFCLHPEALAEF